MRIHTDLITERDIHVATNAAGMRNVFADVTQRGSRSRERSFDVKLTGNSTRKTNPGWANGEREQAATWDEWGMFIHALYEIDPEAVIDMRIRIYRNMDKVRARVERLWAYLKDHTDAAPTA